MTNRDYVNEYFKAIKDLNADLGKRARKAIMEFDKEIDILAIMAHDLDLDREDTEVLDYAYSNCEWGVVASRYDENIDCAILGVRYNRDNHTIEAFMKDYNNGIIDEWMNINYFSSDAESSVYVTILEFIDQAKALCSL